MAKGTGKAAQKKRSKSDFAKVRHKVGRKVPQAVNATNTTVKAKRLVLAGQTLGADRSDRALTSRGLAIEEVLAQVVHYAPRVRRDALQGLRELLGGNPWLLSLHAARVFDALAPRLTDGEREVRSALRSLLRDVVLPSLPPAALAPFVPLLALHTAGAMTNLDEGVRRDAVAALDVLLQAAPRAVCAGAPGAMLRHFVDLLAGGPGGVRWAAAPLGAVVASLQALLTALLEHLQALQPGGASADSDNDDDDTAEQAWLWAPSAPPPPPLHACRAWGAVVDNSQESDALTTAEPPMEVVMACAALTPRLLTIWGQLAPALGDPGGADVAALACLAGVLRSSALCAAVARNAATGAATMRGAAAQLAAADASMRAVHAELLASLRRCFPAPTTAAPATPEGRAAVEELNLCVAELLLLTEHGSSAVALHAHQLHAVAAVYVANALRGLAAARGGGASAAADAAPHADAAVQLLRLARGALLHPGTAPAEREALLTAVSALWEAAPPRSAHKAAVLRLVERLLRTPAACVPPAVACGWLASLPRLLFELRHAAPGASARALRTLLDAARCAAPGSPYADALGALEPELAPFFALCVSGRAPRPGPFLRFPPPLQAQALALLVSLPRVSAPTLRVVALCALSPDAPPCAATRAAEAVACAPGAELPLRLGWMGTLLLGADSAGCRGVALPQQADSPAAGTPPAAGGLSWRQRREAVRAACVGLSALAPSLGGASHWAGLAALWPAVQQSGALAQPRVPRHIAFAFLHAAADAAATAASAAGADEAPEDPPPELASALPRLLADYLAASAAEHALAVPPDIAPRCVDADDPGAQPAEALLRVCPSLMGAAAAALAARATATPAALPDCLTALAALAARSDMHAALLHGRGAVEAAAEALTTAETLQMPHSAVARHLRVALRQLYAQD